MYTNFYGFAMSNPNTSAVKEFFAAISERPVCFPPHSRFGVKQPIFKSFVDTSHPLGEKLNEFLEQFFHKKFNENNRSETFNTLIISWDSQSKLFLNENQKLFPNTTEGMPPLNVAVLDSISNLEHELLLATTIGPSGIKNELRRKFFTNVNGKNILIPIKEFNPFEEKVVVAGVPELVIVGEEERKKALLEVV